MSGRLRLAFTVFSAAVALLLLLPFHIIGVLAGGRAASAVTPLWHRVVMRLIGIRVIVTGEPSRERPLLLLANHISWLDISVMASVAPVSFIAKKEVAGWPVVGWLAKLQRSVFIDRERRSATGVKTDEVAGRLSQGDIIVLFAEGTSGDGNKILPFRTALIGAAQRAVEQASEGAVIQPVAIAYTRMLGLPLGRQHRPRVAWYGGTDLLPHLTRLLSEGAVDVHVMFGPARRLAPGENRKAAAADANAFIRHALSLLNSGRATAEAIRTGAIGDSA
jgi:1-acyl-sn-glycerol-3-phosphate acyltransferase